jgi:hypothetical protein
VGDSVLAVWLILALFLTPFGVVLLAVGVILRLVEWSWEKGQGRYGSTGLLAAGGLLCLPLLAFLATGFLGQLTR